jgi:hypothetical protein
MRFPRARSTTGAIARVPARIISNMNRIETPTNVKLRIVVPMMTAIAIPAASIVMVGIRRMWPPTSRIPIERHQPVRQRKAPIPIRTPIAAAGSRRRPPTSSSTPGTTPVERERIRAANGMYARK